MGWRGILKHFFIKRAFLGQNDAMDFIHSGEFHHVLEDGGKRRLSRGEGIKNELC